MVTFDSRKQICTINVQLTETKDEGKCPDHHQPVVSVANQKYNSPVCIVLFATYLVPVIVLTSCAALLLSVVSSVLRSSHFIFSVNKYALYGDVVFTVCYGSDIPLSLSNTFSRCCITADSPGVEIMWFQMRLKSPTSQQ